MKRSQSAASGDPQFPLDRAEEEATTIPLRIQQPLMSFEVPTPNLSPRRAMGFSVESRPTATRRLPRISHKNLGHSCLLLVLLLSLLTNAQAHISCISPVECREKVGPDSTCLTDAGYCSNPYHRYGCLAQHADRIPRLQNRTLLRTCHSDDPPDAVTRGYCQPSPLDYVEIRVSSQNWESVFFTAWIWQILLSELLQVPVSIETGQANTNVDFYNEQLRMEYGVANDWHGLRQGHSVQDCRKVKSVVASNNNPESSDLPADQNYISCTHAIPEMWTGHSVTLRQLQTEEVIEAPGGLGALGAQSWFVPRFTAQENPALLTYLGIQETQENRHTLAQTFLRPTTWEDYCLYESADNCQTPNEIAQRPPQTAAERVQYFNQENQLYIGHFRNTTQNDCVKWPNNCTGHIVDFPCGWASYVSQQAHHLDIAVESNGNQPGSNGYSYGEMTQIWAAANATRSHVLMQWWQPEALYQEYLGTDAEFQKVRLPPPTQDCIEHRVDPLDRCSDDPAVRVGDARGACAEAPHALFKIVGTAVFDVSHSPLVSPALHSPAYQALKQFRISDLQLGKIFDYWFAFEDRDRWNLDPREAVCNWVVDNFEELETAVVPRTYPRVIQDKNDQVYQEPVFILAITLACVAIFCTCVSTGMTFYLRTEQVMRLAQVDFLGMLLAGLLMVSLGALLTALTPSDAICVSIVWLINFGYTLELVPLIVKVAAINRLMVMATHMRGSVVGRQRAHQVKSQNLYGAVALIAVFMCAGLVVWTVVDPPTQTSEVTLSDFQTKAGETIIERTFYCQSDRELWNYLSVSWQLLLLLAASVLAFQTRKMKMPSINEDINETRTLAMMIYSHFVFVMLRTITYAMDSKNANSNNSSASVEQSELAAARSIIYSADTLATLMIYFFPKFLKSFSKNSDGSNPNSSEDKGGSNTNEGQNFLATPDYTGEDPEQQRANVHNNWESRPLQQPQEVAKSAVASARRLRDQYESSSIHSGHGDSMLSTEESPALAAAGNAVVVAENGIFGQTSSTGSAMHHQDFIRDSLNLNKSSTSSRSSTGMGSGMRTPTFSFRAGSMDYNSRASGLAAVSEVGSMSEETESIKQHQQQLSPEQSSRNRAAGNESTNSSQHMYLHL